MAYERRKYGLYGKTIIPVSKSAAQKDSYTPGGEMGKRPDYATIVYSNLIRTWSEKANHSRRYRSQPAASAIHYDYWSGKMKRSILLDSQANLISYGMGGRSIVGGSQMHWLASGIEAKGYHLHRGNLFIRRETWILFTTKSVCRLTARFSSDKKTYAESFLHPVQQHRSIFGETPR